MHRLRTKNSGGYSEKKQQGNLAPIFYLNDLEYMYPHRTLVRFCVSILSIISNLLGIELYFKVHYPFLSYPRELWEPLIFISKMKKLNLIEYFKWSGSSPDEPKLYSFFLKNTLPPSRQYLGVNGSGRSFERLTEAAWTAIGEAIERRSLITFSPVSFIDASYREIKKEAVDIFSLAGISNEQRKKGCPQLPRPLTFSDSTQFRWVKGYSLTQKRSIWIPLQLTSFTFHAAFKEPVLRLPISTGAAAHKTLEQALVNGILELIERDAFMITWLNKLSPDRIIVEERQNSELKPILASFKRYYLDLHLLYLPTDFSTHVVLALCIDHTGNGPAVTVGTSAHFDLTIAAINAMKSVCGIRNSIKGLSLVNGDESKPSSNDSLPSNQHERPLYWYPTKKIKDVLFLTNGREKTMSTFPLYKDETKSMVDKQLHRLTNDFKKRDLELSYVDILEDKLKEDLGFQAVMAISPQLQPMYLKEFLPYRHGERLDSIPRLFDLVPLKEKNEMVLPFV